MPERFEVDGRIAAKVDGEGYQANFVWRHLQDGDAIDVQSPLGLTLGRMELQGSTARFFDRHGALRADGDMERLTARELGWPLPAAGLRYWLLGLADPDSPSSWSENSEGRLLSQYGWQVEFTGAQNEAPSRLILRREGLEVRIALHDWRIDTPSIKP
ncbi:outer membrane lipoprotein LolB [Parachitinimonas caeni]|uniref:Outer-membrane lipoprotein LolB n=1 Tax=Parachitinimonas caeni TaxID=3031301 RepID=A0ABT7E201_9NEIS|nr:outer membrane lipoprotein LolB [Parachitinimonas caeni]MDK2126333.1 outer membrane lipoprotein LolB [Parachitinimonas caeni]